MNRSRAFPASALGLTLLAAVFVSSMTGAARAVVLQNPTADLPSRSIPSTIDGTLTNVGWGIYPNATVANTAVFQTQSPVVAGPLGTELTFNLYQQFAGDPGFTFLMSRFRLSVTTDTNPTDVVAGGSATWTQLNPTLAIITSTYGGDTFTVNPGTDTNAIEVGGVISDDTNDTYTVVVDTTVNNITGFRLEALPGTNGTVSRDDLGSENNFILSEFTVDAVALPEPASLSLLAVGSLLALRRTRRAA